MKGLPALALAAALFAATARADGGAPHVAIFDFGMTAGDASWAWLEKGLPDLATTDFVDRGVPVVAREQMERVAMAMHWAPELVREHPEKLDEIRRNLQIDYVVTGTYRVEAGRVTLTAQIVNIFNRREVFRREITGAADDILDLQRKLSAALLGWFSHREDAAILPQLKPWTRSVPAARALYEGMHLYDQGRYGDAWVRFREAARQDPGYSDASYWTARMYYFMDQYEHARLAFGDFVRRYPGHPHVGDSVKEYLHTYEKLDRPPEELLALYGRLAETYGNVQVFNEMDRSAGVTAKEWLEVRSGQLLGQLGRYREGAEIASRGRERLSGWEDDIAGGNADAQYQLTGEEMLTPAQRYASTNRIIFREDQPEVTVRQDYHDRYWWWCFIAPTGCAFKSLHVFLIADPGKISLGMHLHKDDYGDVPSPRSGASLAYAMSEGFNFTNLPRSPCFRFHIWRNDNPQDPAVNFHGLRVKAEFERVGPQGAIDVHCDSTHNFRVDVDGRMGRAGDGLIGLIPPGEHALRFSIGRKSLYPFVSNTTPFAAWETNVVVKTGAVVEVTGHLPWKEDSPWRTWTTGRLIGRDYPGYYLHLANERGAPAIQADDDALRVVWAYMGDLWWSATTNDDAFTPPEKFPMPISSGWVERRPQVLHDQSGRFLLTFISDRNAQRQDRLYASWSRDFHHWSAPAVVADHTLWKYDLVQDAGGRYLLADGAQTSVTIRTSRDGLQWEDLAVLPLPGMVRGLRLLACRDGTYEVGAVFDGPRPEKQRLHNGTICNHVGLFRSADAVTWSALREVTLLQSSGDEEFGMMRPRDRTFFTFFEESNRPIPEQMLMYTEQSDGTWKMSPRVPAMAGEMGTMSWHPRWGYLISWVGHQFMSFPLSSSGPYLVRGPDLKGVFGADWAE